jgi:transcriptional regulator with XRE-family HTH domain
MTGRRYGDHVAGRSASTAVRRQLGGELRRLRAKRRAADVAAQLGWSESKLSRIETARTAIGAADLDRLLSVYGVPSDARLRLRDLATQTQQRAWWHPYRAAVADPYERYVAYESDAVAMYEWEPQIVPGLLQTDEYARAVVEADRNPGDQEIVEQRVALRMARHSVLTRRPEPLLWAIIDEGVLLRQVGGRDVMRRQVQRLYDASHRPAITLQVLPFAAGIHLAVTGAFTIFEFAAEGSPPVVHSDGVTGGTFRDKPAEVQAYRAVLDDVRRKALDVDATRALLAEVGARLQAS